MNFKYAAASLILSLAFTGAAHAATQTETFESCQPNVTGIATLSAAAPGPCSAIAPGITFAADPGFDLYTAAAGQSGNPTIALGVDRPAGGNDNISFASPVTVFSADFDQNLGGGTQSGNPEPFVLSTFLGGLLVNSYNFNVASGSPTTFGFTSTPFDSLKISQPDGFAVIDNVTFGTAAVPEPATWAMMLTGLGLVGASIRKRNLRMTVAYA